MAKKLTQNGLKRPFGPAPLCPRRPSPHSVLLSSLFIERPPREGALDIPPLVDHTASQPSAPTHDPINDRFLAPDGFHHRFSGHLSRRKAFLNPMPF